MAVERTSSAQWEGNLKNGRGEFALGTGDCRGSFTFATRFESEPGTNPEELIAAAHAACFAMAFSNMLASEGYTPDRVDVDATVTLDADRGMVTRSALRCTGHVPGIDDATFQEIGVRAKDGCPISKTLGALDEITLDATLAQ